MIQAQIRNLFQHKEVPFPGLDGCYNRQMDQIREQSLHTVSNNWNSWSGNGKKSIIGAWSLQRSIITIFIVNRSRSMRSNKNSDQHSVEIKMQKHVQTSKIRYAR
ncbi:hypothetical protein O6H91_18G045700 [Diphasiastrum complanatum]|uniref:Uncharacterized protein n=1 Tax=Diphasiastrum complanatum TaxID=34168 RepID=A0ACC2B0J9_DIPCM|nr:hypothetical protein O6H91_18G045700 [Diphasiastrum complanatum]